MREGESEKERCCQTVYPAVSSLIQYVCKRVSAYFYLERVHVKREGKREKETKIERGRLSLSTEGHIEQTHVTSPTE